MRFSMINGKTIDAYNYDYRDMDKLLCPCCKQQVVFCKGEIKLPYFRHVSLHDCPYSLYDKDKDNQSEIHILIKKYLSDMLKRDNPTAKVTEQEIIANGDKKMIADVYAEYQYKDITYKYAFEIQKSHKSKKSIYLKNEFYKKCGVIPVWIKDEQLDKLDKRLTSYTFNVGKQFHHGYLAFKDNRDVQYMFMDKDKIEESKKRRGNFSIDYIDSNEYIKDGIMHRTAYQILNFKLYGNKIFNYAISIYRNNI